MKSQRQQDAHETRHLTVSAFPFSLQSSLSWQDVHKHIPWYQNLRVCWLVRRKKKKKKKKNSYKATPKSLKRLLQWNIDWKVGALYSDHISRPPLVKLLLPWKRSVHVFQTPSLARPFLPPSIAPSLAPLLDRSPACTEPQAEGLCSHIVFIRAAERLEEESHSLLKRRSLNSLQTRQKEKMRTIFFYCLPMKEYSL